MRAFAKKSCWHLSFPCWMRGSFNNSFWQIGSNQFSTDTEIRCECVVADWVNKSHPNVRGGKKEKKRWSRLVWGKPTCNVHPKTPIISMAMHRYSEKTSHHGFRTRNWGFCSVVKFRNSPTGIILADVWNEKVKAMIKWVWEKIEKLNVR